MVKGLDLFRERFREFEGSFTLIGGAACDEWFTAQGLPRKGTMGSHLTIQQLTESEGGISLTIVAWGNRTNTSGNTRKSNRLPNPGPYQCNGQYFMHY